MKNNLKLYSILILGLFWTGLSFAQTETLKVGQKYQGGIIAHINSDGKTGLIVAEKWFANKNWVDAQLSCKTLSMNGFDDWRLPNTTELQYIFDNIYLEGIQEFGGKTKYWSISEGSYTNQAKCFDFSNREYYSYSKDAKLYAIPVRGF